MKGVRATADRKVERFTGLLVGDDGKVKRVLHGEMFKLPAGTRVLNGGGKVLMPGLIDAHGHVMGYGAGAGAARPYRHAEALPNCSSGCAIMRRPIRRCRGLPGAAGTRNCGRTSSFPTSADLDAVVKDRPVWLERVDGHASVGNSAALAAAGVTAATKAPSGGKIENGLFVDAATALVDRHVPAPTAAMSDAALLRAQEALLSRGLTAVADMGTSLPDWQALNRAERDGALKLRIFSYATQGVLLDLQKPGAAGLGERAMLLKVTGREALCRWRAGLARGVAQAAVQRRAGYPRACRC